MDQGTVGGGGERGGCVVLYSVVSAAMALEYCGMYLTTTQVGAIRPTQNQPLVQMT